MFTQKSMLKNLALMVLLALGVNLFAPGVLVKAAPQKKMFMVSAYYSPQPNQRFYMKGGYEADMVLNGRGTNGADGTPVYVGMLAAPKNYPFGTKIKLPGLGVGEVHDRGGAIISTQNYDRIDVWMGKGEAGLSRALNWGMRLVEGEIDYEGTTLVENLNFNHISAQLPSGTLNRLLAKTSIDSDVISQPIASDSTKSSIEELQETLKLFGYYHHEINGDYTDQLRQAVLAFQLAEGVVASADAQGAGHFGPKTRAKLLEKSKTFNDGANEKRKALKEDLKNLTVGLSESSSGDQVIQLQKMLWELGYYYGPFSGLYDIMTTEAVFKFQKDFGVIQDDSTPGAGYFGPKTHSAMVSAVSKRAQKIAEGPKQASTWAPANKPLPTLNDLQTHFNLTEKIELNFNPVVAELKFKKDLFLGSRNEEVVKMQTELIRLGYLETGLNTGYFGSKTKEALLKFQFDKKIILSESDQGAGVFGPTTRSELSFS